MMFLLWVNTNVTETTVGNIFSLIRFCLISSKVSIIYVNRCNIKQNLYSVIWLLAFGRQFTVQNPDELYVLVSSALPTTRRDMTCTVLKATYNPR